MFFTSPKLSLNDMLGVEYMRSVVQANVFLERMTAEKAEALATETVDFFPAEQQKQNETLLQQVGKQVIKPFANNMEGAATNAFMKAAHKEIFYRQKRTLSCVSRP